MQGRRCLVLIKLLNKAKKSCSDSLEVGNISLHQKCKLKKELVQLKLQGHHCFYSLDVFAGFSIYNTLPGVPRHGRPVKKNTVRSL